VKRQVTQELQNMVGGKSAHLVETMMSAQKHGGSLIATIVGGAGLILGAAGVFGQLQDALNTIWEVKSKPGTGIWGFIRQRFLSMAMVLGLGFLLLVSMALSAFVNAFAGYISAMISMPKWVPPTFNFVIMFGVITVLFAAIFKVLPDVKVKWRHVWIGAVVTSLLFVLGKFALGLYLGRAGATSAYGAGAAFVLILLYIYYSSVILFFGAEFTQVYARAHEVVQPTKYAVAMNEGERAQEGMVAGNRQKPQGERRAGGKEQQSPQPAHGAPAYATKASPTPVLAKTSTTESMHKKSTVKAEPMRMRVPRTPPVEQIKNQPWSFVGLALTMGLAAGAMVRIKTLRKALKAYMFVRKYT